MADAPAIERFTITIAKVFAPGAGKKFGRIQDSNGNYWLAQPAHFDKLQEGQTVAIEAHTEYWADKNDKSKKSKVDIINRIQDAAPRTNGTQAPVFVPENRDRAIFLCGVVQNMFHGLGYPGTEPFYSTLRGILAAYDRALADHASSKTTQPLPKPQPRQMPQGDGPIGPEPPLNDEVPF